MTTLVLKLALTPVLIGGASLAGRRWGGALAGWLVALPLTSGPVAAFLVAEHGARFASRAAVGSISGVPAEVAFCLGYGWTARRGWPTSLAVGTAAFAAAGTALEALPLSPRLAVVVPLFVGALGVLALGRALLPRVEAPVAIPPPPRWDLPARAVVATALVVALTEAAGAVGARLTGLIAVFPVYVSVLASFAGRDAVVPILRGVLLGLVSFATFFLVLGALLTRIDPVAAFASATAAALAVQAASLRTVRMAP